MHAIFFKNQSYTGFCEIDLKYQDMIFNLNLNNIKYGLLSKILKS
jgi:hypothetical protein